jgi:hypothetical protein
LPIGQPATELSTGHGCGSSCQKKRDRPSKLHFSLAIRVVSLVIHHSEPDWNGSLFYGLFMASVLAYGLGAGRGLVESAGDHDCGCTDQF